MQPDHPTAEVNQISGENDGPILRKRLFHFIILQPFSSAWKNICSLSFIPDLNPNNGLPVVITSPPRRQQWSA